MWLNMGLVDSSDYNNTRTIFSHLFHQETIEFILSLAPLVQVSGIGTCGTIKQKRKPPSKYQRHQIFSELFIQSYL